MNNRTLYEVLLQTARNKPNQKSTQFFSNSMSYSQLLHYVDCLSAALIDRYNLKKGDVVTVCLPNSPSAQIAFYALNKAGATINLVHPKIAALQLVASIKATKSVLTISYDLYPHNSSIEGNLLLSDTSAFMDLLTRTLFRLKNRKLMPKDNRLENLIKLGEKLPHQTAEKFGDDEAAAYLPSGGTTANPKMIMHSNRAFDLLCQRGLYCLSVQSAEEHSALYSVLPIFHGYGLCMNMLLAVEMGICNVMCIKFSAKDFARAIEKHKVSFVLGVPSMYAKLVGDKHFRNADLSGLKNCFVGGDPIPLAMTNELNEILARRGSSAVIHEGYGLTETVTVCAVNNKENFRQGSVGKPLPDTVIKIVDESGAEVSRGVIGEICINSPMIMLGYLGSDENPVKVIDGQRWLFSGDLGYMDADGFLFFKQRVRGMIKVSGTPVYPSEIEEVAERIVEVTKAAAIGIKSETVGEVVKLFVQVPTLNEKNHDEIKQKIAQECTANLIKYAVPQQIILQKELPLNDLGKVDKRKLS